MLIDFDETNFTDVSRILKKIVKIKQRLIKANPELSLTNSHTQKRLQGETKNIQAINDIFHTNITSLYENHDNDRRDFYVYVHCNPLLALNAKTGAKHIFCASTLKLTHVPFYVGKGYQDRCYDLNRNEGHRKVKQMIESVGQTIIVCKVIENLSESEALAFESKLIDILVLKQLYHSNFLVNLDEGARAEERRNLYPKGVSRYLNKTKMRLYK